MKGTAMTCKCRRYRNRWDPTQSGTIQVLLYLAFATLFTGGASALALVVFDALGPVGEFVRAF